jgi:hypothetical protein
MIELFDLVFQAYPEKVDHELSLNTICGWKLADKNNDVLEALLEHKKDVICTEWMGTYEHFLRKELLLKALREGNTTFMRKAQIAGAFPKFFFGDEEVIKVIIE